MLSVSRFRSSGVLSRVLGLASLAALLLVAGCSTNPAAPQFSITTTSAQLAAGIINVAYGPTTFTASNGTGALTWTVTSGLPTGMTVSAAGVLSGTPTQSGAFTLTVSVTDSASPAHTATASLTLKIDQAPAITSANSTTFTVGAAGSFTVAASGYPASTFSETGALPSGVTLNSTTGVLSGTPAAATGGTYTITITAQNGTTPNATQSFTLTVDQAPAVTSANRTTFTVGTAGSFTVMTSGFPTPSISDGGATLPSGVTFTDNGNGTGTLAGTPAAGTAGNYPITFTPSNGVGSPAAQNFTLTVGQAPAITSGSNTTFTVGAAGSFTITATGFPAPTFMEVGGLPSGVTFNSTTGVLSGMPAAGTGKAYSITFSAQNSVGTTPNQSFTLTVDQAPAITSGSSTTFTVGTAGTFTVNASGFPTPSISDGGATLPSGVTFTDNGNGTGTLAGTPAAGTAGNYSITFTPNNGVGSPAAQNFTLTVGQAPAITSGSNTTFTVGAAGSFTITATGFPTPTFSETGLLPSGVTLNSTTGVLSGTPAAGTGKTYTFTITASNGVGSNATQNFTLTVDEAPSITSGNSTTFAVGGPGSFTVKTSGFPLPSISDGGATLPSGVTFTDNGNGTGTLAGTPASGTNGNYPITFTASNGVGSNATQNFTLTVNTAPAFTSANSTTFTVGTSGSFTVTAVGTPTPTVTESGTLPNGVTFTGGTGSATLSRTPAALTGGTYTITFTASNGVGTNAMQTFTLTVDEAPAISSLNNTTFSEGSFASFTVMTTGFPKNPGMTIMESGGLPSGVTFTDNGNGTGTLSGTPAAGSSTGSPYTITFTASNGVGTNATQNFTLTVNTAPVITSGSSTTFTVGAAGNFSVTTSGSPTPSLTEMGTLPSGVTFTDNGNGSGTLAGTPAARSGAVYNITIKATNTSGNNSQSFTLTVDEAPTITSNNNTTFTIGVNGTFTVTTTGYPLDPITETGALPSGVTLVDNGDNTATLSGTPAAGSNSSYSITITASNGIGSNATQNFTLNVVSDPCQTITGGDESLLSGSGAFLLKGFDNGAGTGETTPEPALVGGVLTFNGTDGNGKITAGTIDMNLNGTAGVQTLTVNSGTYKVNTADHRGCMALNLSNSTTQHYRFSLNGAGTTAHMINFDTAGPFVEGTLRKQSSPIPTTLSGNFAFGVSSADNTAKSGGKFAAAGFMGFASSGAVNSGGELDTNRNGTKIDEGACTSFLSPCTPISITGGSYGPITNGRGQLTFNISAGGQSATVHAMIYVVSSSEAFLLSSDDQTMNEAFAGSALLRSGSFSNSTLTGNYVLYESSINGYSSTVSGGQNGSDTSIRNIAVPSAGNINTFAWQNSGGTLSRQPTSGTQAVTYTVDSNGRMLLPGAGSNPPVFYLVDGTKAFFLDSGGSVSSGEVLKQTSTSSPSGSFAGGTVDPASGFGGGGGEFAVTFSGGNVSGTSDNNSSGGPQPDQAIPLTAVSVDSTGFGQVPSNCTSTNNCQFIFFVISSTSAVGTDGSGTTNPTIQTVDH